jgi:hypothetical protein
LSDVDVDADVTLPSVKLLPKREIAGEARPTVVKSTAGPPSLTFSPFRTMVAALSQSDAPPAKSAASVLSLSAFFFLSLPQSQGLLERCPLKD